MSFHRLNQKSFSYLKIEDVHGPSDDPRNQIHHHTHDCDPWEVQGLEVKVVHEVVALVASSSVAVARQTFRAVEEVQSVHMEHREVVLEVSILDNHHLDTFPVALSQE